MNLAFLSLTLSNFGSFTTEQTFSFDRPPGLYSLRGTNLICPDLGANGVGKTTLWHAFEWCLKGKTSSGLRTPDIQPWNGAKTGSITLKVTSDHGSFSITRSFGPNRLTVNDKPAEQADVDKLIGGLSLATIANAILFGQDEDLFTDRQPRDKLEILIDALDLDRWQLRSVKADKAAKKLDGQVLEADIRLRGLAGAQEANQKHLDALGTQSKAWEEKRTSDHATRSKTLATVEESLKVAQGKLDQAVLELDMAGTELKALRKAYSKIEEDRAAADKSVMQWRSQHSRLTENWIAAEAYLDGLKETCPTCGQKVRATVLRERRQAAELRIKALTEDLTEADNEVSRWEGQFNDLTQHKRLNQTNTKAFEAKEERAEDARNRWQPEVADLKAKLSALRDQDKTKLEEANPYREQIASLRRQLAKTQVEFDQATVAKAELEQRAEAIRFWVKGFKDVCLFVLDEVLDEIELTCNAMLPDVGLSGWAMGFEVERETASGGTQRGLNVTVLSPFNDKAVRWECWSGGEKTRLRIVASLAVAEVLLGYAGIKTNIEVLDEPTKFLSREGTADLTAFLADRAEAQGLQTWWVDHAVVESTRFAGIVGIIRDQEGSKIAK